MTGPSALRPPADRHKVPVNPEHAMIAGGTEVTIGVTDDHVFGPLVLFGLGGAATEVRADHSARLTPLTDTDAGQFIGSIRSAALLRGYYPGQPWPCCWQPGRRPYCFHA